MYATKRLAECWKDCPKPNGAETVIGDGSECDDSEGDAKFLADLGVKFPESQ